MCVKATADLHTLIIFIAYPKQWCCIATLRLLLIMTMFHIFRITFASIHHLVLQQQYLSQLS